MAFLEIIQPNKSNRVITLPTDGLYVIGRGPACDLVLMVSHVSNAHARIGPREDSYQIVDFGSSNGTFVDGKRIENSLLVDECLIRIGKTDIRFHTAAPDIKDKVDVELMGMLMDTPTEEEPQKGGTTKTNEMVEDLVGSLIGEPNSPSVIQLSPDSEKCPTWAELVFLEGPLKEESFRLRMNHSLTLGRNEVCDIQIKDKVLSRRHCEFRLDPEGGLYLTDLDSKNGTFLNKKRMTGKYYRLFSEDEIILGSTLIRIIGYWDPVFEFGGSDSKVDAAEDRIQNS